MERRKPDDAIICEIKKAIEVIALFNADQNRLTDKTLKGSQHVVNTITMHIIILIICNIRNKREIR